MAAYYNEIDPFAAAWLRDLIDAGEIAPGDVDTRSIEDVCPNDLRPYTQVHFFAGIGIWSHALRRAGWADDRRIWTGSCPCQPFSSAGEGNGFADERHLWPAMFHLIAALGPDVVIGEQVASKDGLAWLDLVSADMEAARYAFGAIDLCAAGFGAPHIRQRSWWVALANGQGGRRGKLGDALEPWGSGHADGSIILGRVADGTGSGGRSGLRDSGSTEQRRDIASNNGGANRLDDDDDARPQGYAGDDGATGGRGEPGRSVAAAGISNELVGKLTRLERPGPTNGFWRDVDWLYCRDERWRPVEACAQPLADGLTYCLGYLCDQSIAKFEEEIDAWSVDTQSERAATMRKMRLDLDAQVQRVGPPRGISGFYEASLLLAFLREFENQGRQIPEGIALSCSEASLERVRMLRDRETPSSTSRERNLVGQQTGEPSDAMYFLSSLLARHAHTAWGDNFYAYAEIGLPIGRNSPARVGRLRGYGNGIVAPVATAFIEEIMSIID